MLADQVASVLAGHVERPKRARGMPRRIPLLDEEVRALEALLDQPPSTAKRPSRSEKRASDRLS
jgi:hypothetical protein